MKPRLNLEECDSLIQLLKSQDFESIILGAEMLLSGSYKTTPQLRTAIYRARLIIRLHRVRVGKYIPKEGICARDIQKCFEALERYKQKLIQYGN